MEDRKAQLQELFEQLEEIRLKKHKKFDDINGLVKRVFSQFPDFFPRKTVTQKGVRTVYHPNAPDCHPISIEKEHGNRDCLPPRYAKLALDDIKDLLIYIESRLL